MYGRRASKLLREVASSEKGQLCAYIDYYREEALKMRNLLEEFSYKHGLRQPTILGVREHAFSGSVSSLASFMSNLEASFVTLGQRVLASPLKVRMHYGHPDIFDRIFHITRGGISKASRAINISEDIFAADCPHHVPFFLTAGDCCCREKLSYQCSI